MKAKTIFLSLMIAIFGSQDLMSQTVAVPNMSTHGLHATPEIVAKLTRLELIKLEKYKVLDEFDMISIVESKPEYATCYGKTCLIELGKALDVDYVMSGSVDGLGNKIVVSLKLIDVKEETIKETRSMEFDNQEVELQRMIGIVLQEMHGMSPAPELKKSLEFKNEVITSNNVGRINNAGPRFGVSYVALGDMNEFFTRSENNGGLGIKPVITNIGYQFEGQYIGTENFSALAECVVNVGGMDQGQFIPSVTLMNGFRFGKQGWEFAFGPSFGIRKESVGLFSQEDNKYYTDTEWDQKHYNEWLSNPENYDPSTGIYHNQYERLDRSVYSTNLDNRGWIKLNTSWLMAVGRTFRAGGLNVPVNVYYSNNKYGGIIGASVGFNVINSKKPINQ